MQETLKKCDEYKSEIISLKRIQNEQGKALQKVLVDNNYPNKINSLLDDVKYWKMRCKDSEAELKKDKNTIKELLKSRQELLEQLREFQKKKSQEANFQKVKEGEVT